MTFADSSGPLLADVGFYVALVLGLGLGSLATALAWRLPRGVSMVTQTRSHCPQCDRTLGFIDLIPVVSWLLLRGRCRGCGRAYGLRYLGIELGTLLLCLFFYFILPSGAPALAFYVATPALLAMLAIDFEWQILPDKLNLWLAAAAACAIFLLAGWLPFDIATAGWLCLYALGGAILYGGAAAGLRAFMQWRMGREPMGLGDVKFFAAAGLWLGPDLMRLSIFMLVAGVLGVVLGLAWQRYKKNAEFPFGPALIVAFVGFLLAGETLLLPAGMEYVNRF